MTSKLPQHLALPLIFLCCLKPAMAEVYQWTDEHGKTHFSDQVPQGIAAESFKGAAAVSFMGGGAQTGKVRIFVTQRCPYCKKAKAYLRQRGTPFDEIDVEATRSAADEFKRIGGQGVPVILVGKQRMDGYDEQGLASLLDAAGLP